ncbi:hypothetical protein ACFYXM_11700 [Streptomyces sp. NPDC002476]|uniref:hypothetical protein n=1 Tax=Streptomyces sp. NPDC002476 TaxID=3364648 RepID=UPI0036C8ADE6
MIRIPEPADELAVVYGSDGSRLVAFLDPGLDDSPLRRALHRTHCPRRTPLAPAIDPPGDLR